MTIRGYGTAHARLLRNENKWFQTHRADGRSWCSLSVSSPRRWPSAQSTGKPHEVPAMRSRSKRKPVKSLSHISEFVCSSPTRVRPDNLAAPTCSHVFPFLMFPGLQILSQQFVRPNGSKNHRPHNTWHFRGPIEYDLRSVILQIKYLWIDEPCLAQTRVWFFIFVPLFG